MSYQMIITNLTKGERMEDRWNDDQAGLPDDYSPSEREFDRMMNFHRLNVLSDCCEVPIGNDGNCMKCHNRAGPLTIEKEVNDGF